MIGLKVNVKYMTIMHNIQGRHPEYIIKPM